MAEEFADWIIVAGNDPDDDEGVVLATVYNVVEERTEANGKLMASAPVLAEALADMVTAFEGTQQAPDDGSSVRWELRWVRLIIAAEKSRAALELCGWKWGGR
jgi:hypothetical protein